MQRWQRGRRRDAGTPDRASAAKALGVTSSMRNSPPGHRRPCRTQRGLGGAAVVSSSWPSGEQRFSGLVKRAWIKNRGTDGNSPLTHCRKSSVEGLWLRGRRSICRRLADRAEYDQRRQSKSVECEAMVTVYSAAAERPVKRAAEIPHRKKPADGQSPGDHPGGELDPSLAVPVLYCVQSHPKLKAIERARRYHGIWKTC
jgi:hypothetical protein